MADSKICMTCGRSFTNRHRYGSNWDEVRYCSERCRRHKPSAVDRAIEERILTELRARPGTLSPDELALQMFPEASSSQRERVRQAARRLVAAGAIDFTQQGRVVDPSTARGSVLLRLRP